MGKRQRNKRARQQQQDTYNTRASQGAPPDFQGNEESWLWLDRNTLWLAYFARAKPGDDAVWAQFSQVYSRSMQWSLGMLTALGLFYMHLEPSTHATQIVRMIFLEGTGPLFKQQWAAPLTETSLIWAPIFLQISFILHTITLILSCAGWLTFREYMSYHDQLQQVGFWTVGSIANYAQSHYSFFCCMRSWYFLALLSYLPIATAVGSWFFVTGLIMLYMKDQLLMFTPILFLFAFGIVASFYDVEKSPARLQELSDLHSLYLWAAGMATWEEWMNVFGM